MVITENGQDDILKWMQEILKLTENDIQSSLKYNFTLIKIDNNDNFTITNNSRKYIAPLNLNYANYNLSTTIFYWYTS